MASIVKRKGKYCVVYPVVDHDDKRKQKWQTFDRLEDAKARKAKVEYVRTLGEFKIPACDRAPHHHASAG